MIVRMWRGSVDKAKKDAYVAYLNETGLKDYAAVDGNEAAWLLCRDRGEKVEFVTLTVWRSMDAIRAFAGDPPERARYYPADKDFLDYFEPEVEHYELVTKVERRASPNGFGREASRIRRSPIL